MFCTMFHFTVIGFSLGAPNHRSSSSSRAGIILTGSSFAAMTGVILSNINKGSGMRSISGYVAELHLMVGSCAGISRGGVGSTNITNIIHPSRGSIRMVVKAGIRFMTSRFGGLYGWIWVVVELSKVVV